MSKFGEPQPCRNNCGAWIYFDSQSKAGHPSQDKWIPLEYNKDAGIKTDMPHQCPNRPKSNGSSAQQQQQASTTAVTAATKEDRIMNILNGVTIKLDRLLALLGEKEKEKPEQ
jgi:hypothetical protein